MVTIAVRTGSGDGNELNTSCKIAQKSESPKISRRRKNPPASMIGNRYRKPSETYGFVAQSTTAIEKMRIDATNSDRKRFLGA